MGVRLKVLPSPVMISGLVGALVCLGGAWLYGWWLPLVPPALTWLLSAVAVTIVLSRQIRQGKREKTVGGKYPGEWPGFLARIGKRLS
jgi:CHASE2 domain-containing sensor protein